jgi:hypothetical protein
MFTIPLENYAGHTQWAKLKLPAKVRDLTVSPCPSLKKAPCRPDPIFEQILKEDAEEQPDGGTCH